MRQIKVPEKIGSPQRSTLVISLGIWVIQSHAAKQKLPAMVHHGEGQYSLLMTMSNYQKLSFLIENYIEKVFRMF